MKRGGPRWASCTCIGSRLRFRGAPQPVTAGQQLAHRSFSGREKSPARLGVVLAFEESEKTGLIRSDELAAFRVEGKGTDADVERCSNS
jgi:hypothetical protein